MKLLICGGRDYKDEKQAFDVLDKIHQACVVTTIVSGAASGADTLAFQWAYKNKIKTFMYPADWQKYGDLAGPIRNQEMLDKEKPDIVYAFPGHHGTSDMIDRARRQGFRVLEYPAFSIY